ncbi:16618_t:CDS:10 [Entrophospora sp. SA101]|nr:16618_t:CDS:10 [Entrophospora sp. SA101]
MIRERPIDVEQSEEINNLTESNETDGTESVGEGPTTNKFAKKYGKKVKPVKTYKLYLSSTKCDFSKATYKVAQYCERNRDRLAQIDMLGDLKQESNHKQALIYLKQAAVKADEECPEPVDYAAKDFIKKAANLASEVGEEKADLGLSRWYLCGAKGCFDPDEALAYEHTEKAALKGIAEAEFMMGYFYDAGIHVPANVQIANEWFTKAAEKGNEDAKKKRLGKGITNKEFEEIIELKKQSKDLTETLTKAIIKMVQEVMTYFDNTPDKTTKLELIDTLLKEKLTRLLSEIREEEGKINEAAD